MSETVRKIVADEEGGYRIQCSCDDGAGPSRFVGGGRVFAAQEDLQGKVNPWIIEALPAAEVVPFEPQSMSKEEAVVYKIGLVDERTSELIVDHGFQFQCNGQDLKAFSLTVPDQSTWHGMSIAAMAGILTYPVPVSTDDDYTYLLGSQEDVMTFYASGVQAVNTRLISGRVIKEEVHAAGADPERTWEDVLAVPDNRTIEDLFPDFAP